MLVLQFPFNQGTKYFDLLGFVWQQETIDEYGALRATGVNDILRKQDSKSTNKATIGKSTQNKENLEAINAAKKRGNGAIDPAHPLPGGSFREMLLTCLIDAIENP